MSVPRGRWVVVDEDIDPTDLFDVMWLRLHFQGTQSRCFFHQSQGRNDSGRPARTFLVLLAMPIAQLLAKIFLVVKPAHFKEGRLYESNQVLDAAFCWARYGQHNSNPTPISKVA